MLNNERNFNLELESSAKENTQVLTNIIKQQIKTRPQSNDDQNKDNVSQELCVIHTAVKLRALYRLHDS